MASHKILYRFVNPGHGGTFHFDEKGTKQEQIASIGTYDCMSCTGVYFPIDSQRCFMAHINPAGKAGGKVDENSPLEKFIEDEVLQKLQKHSQAHQWSARAVADHVKSSDIGHQLVIMCPDMRRGTVGYPVLQGIKRFFGADLDVEKYTHPHVTDFVTNHTTGDLEQFKSGSNSSKYEDESWERHDSKYEQIPVFADDAATEWDIKASAPIAAPSGAVSR